MFYKDISHEGIDNDEDVDDRCPSRGKVVILHWCWYDKASFRCWSASRLQPIRDWLKYCTIGFTMSRCTLWWGPVSLGPSKVTFSNKIWDLQSITPKIFVHCTTVPFIKYTLLYSNVVAFNLRAWQDDGTNPFLWGGGKTFLRWTFLFGFLCAYLQYFVNEYFLMSIIWKLHKVYISDQHSHISLCSFSQQDH